MCHDAPVESGWRALAHKSGQNRTRKSNDSDLQGEAIMQPALFNGKSVAFHVFELAVFVLMQ